MTPPFIQTTNSITVVLDGKAMTMAKDHPSWNKVIEALKVDDVDFVALKGLFDMAKSIENYIGDAVSINEGLIRYKGEVVHNLVVDKIVTFMREGLPYKPLVRFLEKLMNNPSRRSIQELYTFLEHKSMPITEDGNFIAYKGVRMNYKDCHTGKFDNSVGAVLEMQRNAVCDDSDNGCSYGFHAGSHEYAKSYASNGGHLMLVEIDPADVVSVPKDCQCQKLRTSKYKVIAKHETIETPLVEEIYGDYDDGDDDGGDEEGKDPDSYGSKVREDTAYEAGYEQAKKDILDKLTY